jgi:hypothetical protein
VALFEAGLVPKPTLGRRANNVIILLDLTQLFCPSFTLLQVLLPASQPTESAAGGGEPCGEPAISLNSHYVSLVQWTNPLLPDTKGPGFKSPGGGGVLM